MKLPINIAQLRREINELALISENPPPVVTRVLFSEADLRARRFVKKLCRAAGLNLREDAVGNIFARWEGMEKKLPAVATGSHMDAIPNAGKYDGVVGVLGAIEAIRALKKSDFKPKRPIELVVFTAEEPTRFGLGMSWQSFARWSLVTPKGRWSAQSGREKSGGWLKQAG